MSGTRLPFRTAPATEFHSALIVAHGSPSSPGAQERAIRARAAGVAKLLPGWTVRGATLAAPGALVAALDALPDRPPLVFPFFMSDGWFVRKNLPQRIRECHSGRFEMMRPLGLDPALHQLCLEQATQAAAGLPAGEATLLLAAHGSPTDPRPRRAAAEVARFIAAANVFRDVRVGFIDEAPFLATVARIDSPALCLPFFAARAGHVDVDLPAALAAASFGGLLLDAIGRHPGIDGIIASALMEQAACCAA